MSQFHNFDFIIELTRSQFYNYNFIIEHNYNNVSQFFARYDRVEKKTNLLNYYLLYCFHFKKFDHIKSIITHLNLDTINMRLTSNHEFLKYNLSLLCCSIFSDDITFVKYLLKQNGKDYIIDQDYCDYYNRQTNLKIDKGTPLFVAANYTKNRDIIDLLIEYGGDINARDSRDLTPIMNVLVYDYENYNSDYYQFLISRGANINLQNKVGNTALHYVIREKKFNVALQLINKCGANPFLINDQKRDGIMEFIICLNHYYTCHESFLWDINFYYIENLLTITNVNRDLIYELFAASNTDIFLKNKYFNKIKNSTILHNDYNSKYWRKRFNAIVGNDDDGDYFIQSVKILNRILHVYNGDTVISMIIDIILPIYDNRHSHFEFKYDKFIKLIIYVVDVISHNLESFKKLYGNASNIYERVFWRFRLFIFRHFQNLLLENILKTYRHMTYQIIRYKHFLENEEGEYCQLVNVIHIYIFDLYKECFYDATKRIRIENYIKNEYPINVLDNNKNCILHNFFQYKIFYKDYINEIIINFLKFILKCNDFKHLNLQNKQNLTPLQLAMFERRNKYIIQLLLDYGSVILNLDYLHSKYDSLNISQRYYSLQNLAAVRVKEQQRHYLPKCLQNIIVH